MKRTRLANNIIRKQAAEIEEQYSLIDSFRRLKKTMVGYIDTLERADKTNTTLQDLLKEQIEVLNEKIEIKDSSINYLKALCFVSVAFAIVGWIF